MIVYIWDMDETLILLKSLINGMYAKCFNGLKDVQRGTEIGRTWENFILDISDQSFFYEDVRLSFLLCCVLCVICRLGPCAFVYVVGFTC